MKIYRLTTITVFSLVLLIAAHVEAQNLTSSLKELVRQANLGSTDVAIRVVDLQTDNILASSNSDKPMLPASNTKLITVAAALGVFGKDFVYHTKLNLIKPQTADLPNLIVIGDGDPAFGDPVLLKKYGYTTGDLLNQWVGAVAKTNINHFGILYIDDNIFDHNFTYPNWPRHQLIRDYCAQVAGLDFHLNCISILPIPAGKEGMTADIKIFPPVPFMPRTNTVITKKGGYFIMDRKLGTNHLIFKGRVSRKPGDPYLLTVNNPPLVFGKILKAQLKEAGVVVDRVLHFPVGRAVPLGKTLALANTALPVVTARCAQDSQNMYAESMFKRLGYALTGQPGSWKNGAEAVHKFLQDYIGPLAAHIHIVDGSGMSRSNRVTAHGIVALLRAMYRHKNLRMTYIHSLSHAGENGTLQNRLKNLRRAQVYAKSGYLRSVSALSGYILLNSDKHTSDHVIAFSFLFNGFKPPVYNPKLKELQDKMVKLVINNF